MIFLQAIGIYTFYESEASVRRKFATSCWMNTPRVSCCYSSERNFTFQSKRKVMTLMMSHIFFLSIEVELSCLWIDFFRLFCTKSISNDTHSFTHKSDAVERSYLHSQFNARFILFYDVRVKSVWYGWLDFDFIYYVCSFNLNYFYDTISSRIGYEFASDFRELMAEITVEKLLVW